MFQKPTFGANTSFGSFNSSATTSSPFGGFKPASTTSAFGAPPAFGAAAAPQPATGGLFGSPNTTSGGMFGSTQSSGFGSTGSGFGFGSSPSSGSLFGAQPAPLFGAQPFQAKPQGFGFGATSTNTTGATNTGSTLFGAAPSGGALFGQNALASNTSGGLFGNTTGGFGQQQTAAGTAHVKYNPVVGTDVVVKSGNQQNINIKHHCITCMKEYENKSLEELRLEDYAAGRKGSTTGVFGGFGQQTENKPLFGGTTAFGQPATTSAPSVFGGGSLGNTSGFGQTSTFSFGGGAQNTTQTNSLFGANKPAFGSNLNTGLFGSTAATTTQAPAFGTATSTFSGFGATTPAQQPSTGLFGAKPAAGAFGAPASSGFGSFGAGGGLFAKPAQTPAPAFGSLNTSGFGATPAAGGAAAGAGGGLFGAGSSFKPAAAPAFGFNQPALGGGLGASTFPSKPATTGFGTLGGSLFQQPQQQNTFKTGLEGLGGGGLFGSSALGAAPAPGGFNTSGLAQGSGLSGAGAGAGSVHEQILSLVARPYGDTPLFKDLLPTTSISADESLKPTNPGAMAAALASSSAYRVGSPPSRLQLHPRSHAHDQKSLFDGLEEHDASLEGKLCLKPSRKRLVLRPKQNDSQDNTAATNRSLEEAAPQRDMPTQTDRAADDVDSAPQNNSDFASEKHASWLHSKVPWSEKDKPTENDPASRLYPDLDKELSPQTSERRSSWLTTKQLRMPASAAETSAEHSVRELAGVARRDKENLDAHAHAHAHAHSRTLSVSDEENLPRESNPQPHPAGVKLSRPGYYTIPSLEEMKAYLRPDGSCVVPHLTIGRRNYGNVFYDCELDVAGLDLDELVHFLNKEVIVYPEDSDKPPVGSGLNRRAVVTLDRIWPRDKTEKLPITDPDRLLTMDYEGKLRRVCDKHDTKFIEYRPQTGSWVFRVEHFSKYGLTDSDEEEDITPAVLKRQIANQSLQKNAAPAQVPPVSASPGLGGLGGLGSLSGGGLGGLGGLGAGPEDTLLAMRQTSLNLLNGAGKAFEMDTTEDNAESQSLYQDTGKSFGVKSPTAELARLENRQSQHVQLMKASIYGDDMDLDDGTSTSTGDQLVPAGRALFRLPPHASAASAAPLDPASVASAASARHDITEAADMRRYAATEHVIDLPMKPLIVNPDKIVLKYNRKVLPFKMTTAGRLGAAHVADMSVSRARHSRVGFGPAGALAFATTYDAVADMPKTGELYSLGAYLRGRGEQDCSEPAVARLALGHAHTHADLQTLTRQMYVLLEWSVFSEEGAEAQGAGGEERCPRATLQGAPEARLAVLKELHAIAAEATDKKTKFGCSPAYRAQVFSLCSALWGLSLAGDECPVAQCRRVRDWLATHAAKEPVVDSEVQEEGEPHSVRVWSLLLAGKLLEACQLSRDHGDLHMAALIAQASSDAVFRSLLARQLSQWESCGADAVIDPYRLAALQLLAGRTAPRDKLMQAPWMAALHATARYLSGGVPTLEQVLVTYTGFFSTAAEGERAELALAEPGQALLRVPLPPYLGDYDACLELQDGRRRRVLDLRYELLAARAHNTRPALRPAAYTPDPMDYSLSFVLGVWFGSVSVESVAGVAEQLQASGAWHLAVLALAYHPDDRARGHLIRNVLSRHVPSRAGSPEQRARLELLDRLHVPKKWVLLAQAHRAKYERLPLLEAVHLAAAAQWNAAHRVLVDELLPEAVLSDDFRSVAPLLEQLQAAAERDEVSGWQAGGQALYHYIKVCEEIRGVVSSAEEGGAAVGAGAAEAESEAGGVQARLLAVRPRLAAACRALQAAKPTSGLAAAARAEMCARLLQLGLAAREPPRRLAALLALPAPGPASAHAAGKIALELAEQASELCAESANSSPLSSHHRAMVQS